MCFSIKEKMISTLVLSKKSCLFIFTHTNTHTREKINKKSIEISNIA
jgi:hypothetical protein